MSSNKNINFESNISSLNFPLNPQIINLKSGTNSQNMKPVNPQIDYFARYLKSFVDDDDFNTKRFQRYVNKVKSFIFEQLLILYPQLKQNGVPMADFNTFCLKIFSIDYTTPDECKGTNDGIVLFFHKSPVREIDKSMCNEDILKMLFDKPSEVVDVIDVSFYNIIDYELTYIMKEYLRRISFSDSSLNKSNYSSFMPTTMIEALSIFKSLLVLVRNDIDKICYSNVNQSFLDVLQSDLVKNLNKEYENMETQLQKTTLELDKANSMVKRLQDSLSAKDNKFEQQTEHLYDTIDDLERKNQKLDKKYAKLLEKYNRLKNENKISSSDIENVEEEDDEKPIEVDMNGKYLFIIGNGATFKGIIKDAFPNAEFMNDNSTINKGIYDMVIIITSHIDHSTYFTVRDQCKNKEIPCIHCDFSNVDRIKQTMFDFINKNINQRYRS